MDRRELTVLTLLDFSKAFDTVDHDLLIAKLKHFHISDSALSWFESYLRECQQYVSFNNKSSSWHNVKVGVPQDSVLGHLLFSVYINDISTVLKHCRHHLYADDLQIYIHSPPDSINNSLMKLNDDLMSVLNWSSSFGLILNPIKSQAIILGQQRLLNTWHDSSSESDFKQYNHSLHFFCIKPWTLPWLKLELANTSETNLQKKLFLFYTL